VILQVLQFPDPALRVVAEPFRKEDVDESVRELAQNLAETMYDEPGIGLAATQVGLHRRLFVMDLGWSEAGERNPRVLLNPEIVEREGTEVSEEEGCLSVPDFNADVERDASVLVRARTLDWEEVEFRAEGLESFCFQHEIDHLDGKLFIDRISSLKRDLYIRRRKKQLKREREEAAPLR